MRTIFQAPAECWCTEMEQISRPVKRFPATQKPLVAGATNKPGGEQARSRHIILTNIGGKIIISTAIFKHGQNCQE